MVKSVTRKLKLYNVAVNSTLAVIYMYMFDLTSSQVIYLPVTAFSALTLSVGCQKEQPVSKN